MLVVLFSVAEKHESLHTGLFKSNVFYLRGNFLELTIIIALSDVLAGPMFSILENGNCEYVYREDANRFPGV